MLYEPGVLKAAVIMGEDPVSGLPDGSRVTTALKALDCLVVCTIAMNETAKIADVVLPAASWGEKDGTFVNAEGRAQTMSRVAEPTGQSLPDWQILRNLSWAMDREINVRSIQDLRDEMGTLAPDAQDGGESRFVPVDPPARPKASGEYPIRLTTRDVLQHSGTMSSRSEALNLVVNESQIEIAAADAERLGLSDNDHARVASENGAVFLKVRVAEDLPEGVAVSSTHFPHGKVNALTALSANGTAPVEFVNIEKA